MDKKDTYGYGSHTGEFKLSRDLVLVDITDPSFYEMLKKWLIDDTISSNTLKQDHAPILFPLGFDDVVFYRDFARKIGIDANTYNLDQIVHTESILYFGGRSRLSIREYDVKLMEFIKPIIGHLCDGIISVKKFPDIIRNGMHHAELGVFDKTDVVYNQDIPQTTTGGSRAREPKTLSGLNIVNDFTRENRYNY